MIRKSIIFFLILLGLIFTMFYFFFLKDFSFQSEKDISQDEIPKADNPFGNTPNQNDPIFSTPTNNDISPQKEPGIIGSPSESLITGVDTKQEKNLLKKLFNGPTAGYRVEKTENNNIFVYVVESGTGYVYKINNTSPNPQRITNTLIPLTFSATFISDEKIILDHFTQTSGDSLETLILSLEEKSESSLFSSISAISFPDNRGYSVARNKETIFYLGVDGSSTNVQEYSIKNNTFKTIYKTPLKSLTIDSWDNIPILASKPSLASEGVIYELKNNRLKQIAPSSTALSFISNPYKKNILTSINNLTIIGENEKDFISIPLETFPEKCSWVNEQDIICAEPTQTNSVGNKNFESFVPDTWYKGQVTFVDGIKFISPPYNNPINIYVPVVGSDAFDIVDLRVIESQKTLFFINKLDGSLWSLNYK